MVDHVDGTTADKQPYAELLGMAFGFRLSQILHTAVLLGIADQLDGQDMSSAELARVVDAHASSLYRLLRALACLRVVEEVSPDRFRLSPLGLPLRAGAEDSVHALILASCDEIVWESWGQLTHSIRTGTTAFEQLTGMTNFDYFARNPEFATHYHEAVSRNTRDFASSILAGVDFSRFRTLVDVGGGRGALMAAALQSVPDLRGILFDTAVGLDTAAQVLDAAGVADRCQIVAGDFFTSLPEGADAYVLKSIVLDWDDHSVARILATCRRAMRAGSSLILIELVAPPRPDAAAGYIALSDLDLLVTTGGRERTEEEFNTLLSSAGFDLISITPLPGEEHLKALEYVPRGPEHTSPYRMSDRVA